MFFRKATEVKTQIATVTGNACDLVQTDSDSPRLAYFAA
jgi:hypothetical protein